MFQRLTITEQSYHEMTSKYNEIQSAKSSVEKELRDLRLALENETLNRNQASEQTAELHSMSYQLLSVVHFIRLKWESVGGKCQSIYIF